MNLPLSHVPANLRFRNAVVASHNSAHDWHLLNEKNDPLRSWSFEHAFPVKWDVEPFQSNKNEVALEKIELTYLLCKRLPETP